jgi:hypothetical protein
MGGYRVKHPRAAIACLMAIYAQAMLAPAFGWWLIIPALAVVPALIVCVGGGEE